MSDARPSGTDLLTDGFGRVRGLVDGIVDGLGTEALAARPGRAGNSIGWLVWHLTRIQDDHLADAAGAGQVWTDDGWADRFGLSLDHADTGYGHDSAQVDAVRVESVDLLVGYHRATYERTCQHLAGWDEADLARVVDEGWDPPVTLAARLVSVLADDLQHAGQAAYARGLLGD